MRLTNYRPNVMTHAEIFTTKRFDRVRQSCDLDLEDTWEPKPIVLVI